MLQHVYMCVYMYRMVWIKDVIISYDEYVEYIHVVTVIYFTDMEDAAAEPMELASAIEENILFIVFNFLV